MAASGTYVLKNFASWTDLKWADLKAQLTSAEGGSLRIVDPKDHQYAVIRYDKQKSDFTKPIVPVCRSIVVHKDTGHVMCVSPMRSHKETDEKVKTFGNIQAFVDGTMVNVFVAPGSDEAVLVTRSRLGAISSFEGKKSFAEQFEDASAAVGITSMASFLRNMQCLKKEHPVFATFVLSHPDNRIVASVTQPSLTLIQVGYVNEKNHVFVVDDSFQWGEAGEKIAAEKYEISEEDKKSVESLKAWVQKKAQSAGYGWQGVVLKDSQGGRIRIRSDLYQMVRKLRGNENSSWERFARLRSGKLIQQYLTFYPEESAAFYELEGRMRSQTRKLLSLYVATFIKKEQAYHELPWPFKYHVSMLHNLYKETLKPAKKTVDLQAVINYVNRLKIEDMANLLKPLRSDSAPSIVKKAEKDEEEVEVEVEAEEEEEEEKAE